MPEPEPRDYASLRGLRLIWRARDQRYAGRRWPLRDREVAMVRTWRADEALDIFPAADIEIATKEARRWTPPEPMR